MMFRTISLLVALLAIVSESQANCPHGISSKGVSSQDQATIVNHHNDLRKLIANGQVGGQPRGVNLKRLYWDSCLASEAQRIADTCDFKHQTATCPAWGWVGQNLGMSWTSSSTDGSIDWTGIIDSWFNEHSEYHFGQGYSHYSQVVWANTDRVGCGYTYFVGDGDLKYQKYYVCNYGPGGNIVGQNPYQTGSSGCENLC